MTPADTAAASQRRLPYYELPELAQTLNRSKRTLQRWERLGLGPRSFRMGKAVCYLHTDVDAWLAELAKKGGFDELPEGEA